MLANPIIYDGSKKMSSTLRRISPNVAGKSTTLKAGSPGEVTQA